MANDIVYARDIRHTKHVFQHKRVAQRIWRLAAILTVSASLNLLGCSSPPAPSPTPNPNPTQIVKLKITIESDSEVNRVEFQSLWVVGNLNCAPLILMAGNRRVKQVDVNEKVEKTGDSYIAKIYRDRFLSDKCHWVGGAGGIRFFHNEKLLSTLGVNDDVLSGERVLKMTCLTSPFVEVGTCGLRDEEGFYKSEDRNAFNVTVELTK